MEIIRSVGALPLDSRTRTVGAGASRMREPKRCRSTSAPKKIRDSSLRC